MNPALELLVKELRLIFKLVQFAVFELKLVPDYKHWVCDICFQKNKTRSVLEYLETLFIPVIYIQIKSYFLG